MKPKKQSLLWQLEHSEISSPSFLFGTMHVRDEQAFVFLEKVYVYLQQCTALAAEYDLSNPGNLNVASAMLLPNGQTIADFFRPAQYQKLEAILFKAFGIPIYQFARFVPIMLINVINEQLLSTERPRALDLELWLQAGVLGKNRLGIETLDEQLEVLQKIPITHQVYLLRSLARNINRFRKSTIKSTSVYQSGDPQKLYRLVRRSSLGMRKLLLFQRNHIMADRISGLAQQQATLFAVGAGHLAGKEGIIPLLKRKGFQLRPIPIKTPPKM